MTGNNRIDYAKLQTMNLAKPMRFTFLALLALLLAGCVTLPGDHTARDTAKEDTPLRAPVPVPEQPEDTLSEGQSAPEAPGATRMMRLTLPGDWQNTMPASMAEPPVDLPEGPFAVNFEAMPVAMFIDEVFGRLLELDFQMEEDVRESDALVTLRLSGPSSGSELYATAMRVLARYGISGFESDGLFWFALNPDAATDPLPLLVTGNALSSVPDTHRPVFQLVPLEVLRNAQVRSWINQMFSGRGLEVLEDPGRNAIILKGPPALVRQAVSAIQVLDQPNMRGRNVLRIDPAWRAASELADELERLMKAQGYEIDVGAGMNAAAMVPVESINALFVFAAGESVLAQVRQWAAELDAPPTPTDEDGVFRYRVQNTSAESIAGVLRTLVGGRTGGSRQPEGERDRREGGAQESITSGGGIVVDNIRNALLFRGTGAQWQQLRPLIIQMDQPTPMVLVEVTIAEITLTNQQDLGVEGLLQDLDLGSFTGRVSTEGGLGLGGSGLTATLDNPGDARLVLNAFRASERVNILSRPHLLVKSGSQASIDVGTEVPIITSQASTADFDSPDGADILQEVQFRETGVLLNVTPTVRGRGVVDLLIEQEVSEAQQTETSNINSPSIFTRRIVTELTARDGRALLMGGLISENRTDGTSGVPGLSRIPLLGRLFRVDGRNATRTELALLLMPYVLPDPNEAEDITEAFRARLAPEHPGRADAQHP